MRHLRGNHDIESPVAKGQRQDGSGHASGARVEAHGLDVRVQVGDAPVPAARCGPAGEFIPERAVTGPKVQQGKRAAIGFAERFWHESLERGGEGKKPVDARQHGIVLRHFRRGPVKRIEIFCLQGAVFQKHALPLRKQKWKRKSMSRRPPVG